LVGTLSELNADRQRVDIADTSWSSPFYYVNKVYYSELAGGEHGNDQSMGLNRDRHVDRGTVAYIVELHSCQSIGRPRGGYENKWP